MLRLSTICSIFPNSDLLIDIGSDHGYLGIELLKQGLVSSVWNVEISKNALENSKKNYEKHNFINKASFLLSDGFKDLFNIPINSTVVCSGLGTSQILKILRFLPENINNLILCSHTQYFEIRKWAQKHKWEIFKEKYVLERNVVYIVLLLHKINMISQYKYSQEELIFGEFKFWKNYFSLFKKYWIVELNRILKIPKEYRNSRDKTIFNLLTDIFNIENV